jgi:hypothetical protein
MSLENHTRGRMLTHIRHSGSDEPDLTAEQRRAAARRIATEADDADECRELLAMLGLTAADGLRPADN